MTSKLTSSFYNILNVVYKNGNKTKNLNMKSLVSWLRAMKIYFTNTNWIKCLMRLSKASTKLLSADVWSCVVAINCLQNVFCEYLHQGFLQCAYIFGCHFPDWGFHWSCYEKNENVFRMKLLCFVPFQLSHSLFLNFECSYCTWIKVRIGYISRMAGVLNRFIVVVRCHWFFLSFVIIYAQIFTHIKLNRLGCVLTDVQS